MSENSLSLSGKGSTCVSSPFSSISAIVFNTAANRLGGAPAPAIPFGRLDIPRIVQLELAQRVLGLTVQFHAFMQARKVTHATSHSPRRACCTCPAPTGHSAAGTRRVCRRRPSAVPGAGLKAAVFLVAHGGCPGILAGHVDCVLEFLVHQLAARVGDIFFNLRSPRRSSHTSATADRNGRL